MSDKEFLDRYLSIFGEIPEFLNDYLKVPSIERLKCIGYFCGMDYASEDIYDFEHYISRFDHSLSVALITYHFTHDKISTLAGLFHDISTPCFAHVIDYMNGDYVNQESTEDLTRLIIEKDKELLSLLERDNISIDEVSDFKRYPIVDNDRPMICADRLDGIFLTGLIWTKSLSLEEVEELSTHVVFNGTELGFDSYDAAFRIYEVNSVINSYCHSNEDNYMMNLLSDLTRYVIDNGYIKYIDLFTKTEEEIYGLFSSIKDPEFKKEFSNFKSIKKRNVPKTEIPKVKDRIINPLVKGERLIND